MNNYLERYDFPKQRVPASEKNKESWYAACCDWIIAQAVACKDEKDLIVKYEALNGKIPDDYYKKVLNPYNATNEKYKRFPATLRNYDLMKGVIRRYIGEYIKNPHEFIVGANNPEVVIAKDSKLKQELQKLVEQQIANAIAQSYKQWVEQGNEPNEFNLQESIDVEAFVKEFNENYIDDISEQAQSIFNIIRDITEDTLLYTRAYFDFVSFGTTCTYTDVVGNKLVKRVVNPLDVYRIPTDNMFIEDDDMFCERRKLTYQQIVDEFGDYLNDKQLEFINTYYGKHSNAQQLTYNVYRSFFPDTCDKFNNEDKNYLNNVNFIERDNNSGLYDVWHVVWRGEVRTAIVSFINEAGFLDKRVETEDYKLNKELGDIDIEYVYVPQVYECTRIGGRNDAIYPYKARAIAFDRNGKLPYNGLTELLPGFGKFSIVDIMLPFQIFYNIVAYHREMTIAKNKLNVLMIAKSLLGKVPEDTIYKMLADGVLYIDDTNDSGMLRAQQVRMLQSNIGDYINQLTILLKEIKEAANEQVDMTNQRYGEIANSAGKAVTEEAVNRGSMGTVIVEFIMDCMRERDYGRDMDFSKLAWIDGLDTSYRDINNNLKYISINVDNHVYADYVIKVKNSVDEKEKLNQLKQFAFSAAQNGDNMMAIAAIQGENVASVAKLIKRFQEQKDAHEEQMQQMEQQTAQMNQQFELEKIHAKGEEDRKTKELEGYLDQQIELIKADANMISFNADVGDKAQKAGIDRLNDARTRVEHEKIALEQQKSMIDTYNKERDRQVKMHDIDTKLKIAKENKNRYDFKRK